MESSFIKTVYCYRTAGFIISAYLIIVFSLYDDTGICLFSYLNLL